MEIRTVTACYFSPTDTTKKTVEAIAHGNRPVINILDLTLPSAREAQYHFGPEDLLVIGAPVYGGRIPLVEEEAIRHIHGGLVRRWCWPPYTATALMKTRCWSCGICCPARALFQWRQALFIGDTFLR